MLASDLEQLGFSETEARVYLAVLELGASFVSAIAKKSNLPRVNCYHTLDNLLKRGIISSFTKNRVKYFSVDSPQILVNQQEEKFQRAQKILPELLSLTNSLAYKPKIQYYEGWEGVKNIFEDTLSGEGELLGYTNLKELPNVVNEDYLREYARKKMKKRLKTRMLSPLSPEALKYLDKYYPPDRDPNLTEILFVNPKEFMFEYEINIYGNKVSVVSLNPQELIGFIIESSVYARTQRGIFDLAWLGATSFVAK